MSFKKKVTIAVIYALIVCFTVISGIVVRNFIENPFEQAEGFEMNEIEETNGNAKVNVLVIGVDKTEGLSDVIMVVRYDEEHNRIAAMSIPRDTYVNYKGTRLVNSVYGAGGIDAVSKVVTQLTGLKINY
ncbi:MAG: LCP family protein, partial [Clostridia bacterium]|nr:LCP family protein [Clostridia bacterium]